MSKFYIVILLLWFSQLYGQGVFHNVSINTSGPVSDITIDGQGNVWMSTHDGVWRHDLFSQASIFLDTLNGIPKLPVYHLSLNSSGDLYLTGADKTVSTWDNQSGSFTSLNQVASQSFSHFTYVYHASGNTTYFGTDNGLVLTQSGTSSALIEKTQYTNAHNLGNITSISKTSDQSVTAVLSTNGIILDIQGFILPVTSASLLPADSVISGFMHRDISYDGTIAGLYIADFSNGAPPVVGSFNMSNSPIPSNRINALVAYGDSLYIGTDAGLAIYDLTTNNWTLFDQNNSNLPSNDIRHLATDPNGRLWIASGTSNLSTWSQGIGLEEESVRLHFFTLVDRQLVLDSELISGDFQIYTLSGQKVYEGIVSEDEIFLNNLATGVYVLAAQSKSGEVLVSKITLF